MNSHASALDLATILRPDDHVLIAQGAGEPHLLTALLVEQREMLPAVTALLGLSLANTIASEHTAHLDVSVLVGVGTNARLTTAGCADVVPVQLAQIPRLIHTGAIPVDVVFIQVSPVNEHGVHSLGVTADFLEAAIDCARVVVAEVNDQMPWTCGRSLIAAERIHHRIYSSRPLPVVESRPSGDIENAIARHVSDLIPDRSVLQIGVGNVPDAVLRSLGDRRDLGVHTGLVSDSLLALIEQGVVTNAYKPIDRGVTVAGVLIGSKRLYDWADRNAQLSMQPVNYTHASEVLGQLPTFTSINSALEVDLTGQVNAETLSGNYIGGVGGQVDFVRAGTAAPRGRSIIALPASARAGTRSRIVPTLDDGTVTSLRTDVDAIITEYGVAQLQGCSLRERARRMISIAHPAHREELERAVARGRGGRRGKDVAGPTHGNAH